MPLRNLPKAIRAAIASVRANRANRRQPRGVLHRIVRGTIIVFGAIVIINMIAGMFSDDTPGRQATGQATAPTEQVGQPQAWEAHVICQNFVRNRLHAPATAKFPARGRIEQDVGDQTFHILSHVDAQNLYGATIRNTYACTTQHTGGDNWRLIALEIN